MLFYIYCGAFCDFVQITVGCKFFVIDLATDFVRNNRKTVRFLKIISNRRWKKSEGNSGEKKTAVNLKLPT